MADSKRPYHRVTLEEKEAFRAHYLYSGNAAESSREIGIPSSTGRDLAKALQDDESFAIDRRKLRAQALDELVAMRMRVARKATERCLADREFLPGEIDKRPDYGKLVVEAEKAAHNLAKLESESSKPANDSKEVVINVYGPDGWEVANGGDSDGKPPEAA